MNRRTFMRGAAVGAAAGLAARSAKGANERVQVGLIGCGGRGRFVVRGIAEAGAHIKYLCDLNDARAGETAKFIADVQEDRPEFLRDLHKVLDDPEIDAVIVATPDHWHSPAAILACQAGKDVYVEKPHSQNIWESGQLIKAARKYDRVVQVGTQNRSGAYNLAARDLVRGGKIGEIALAKVYNLKSGKAYHLGEPGTPPPGFDWDIWLGTRPERPWHQSIYEHGWHKFWDYSGGDLADDGIHQLDLALMLLGDPGMPKRVSCTGGRFIYGDDDAEVPDTQVATFEFDNLVLTLELTGYPKYMEKTTSTIRRNDEFPYWTQNATRVELYGTDALMTVGRHGGGWQIMGAGGRVSEQMFGRPCDEEHYANFLARVKDRKRPNADVAIAHRACTMIHMANIAHRLGNISLSYDEDAGRFVDSEAANALLRPRMRAKFAVPDQV